VTAVKPLDAAAPTPDWLPPLFAGERGALARAITAVENETAEAPAVLAAIRPKLGRALVVGFTGAPGAGKSTLVAAYIGEVRQRGLSVGVVAVDPSSPITGGALLGDRIRMTAHATDTGVFVRSLASRGHLGGLTRTASRVIDVMDAAGKDIVLVETVGAGQNEVEIADVADIRVVVLAPGLGDEIQAIKAGILEIADILVVNKADHPLAERTARQLAGVGSAALLKTTATTGAGVAELVDAVAKLAAERRRQGERASPIDRVRRLLASLAAEQVRRAVAAHATDEMDRLCETLLRGEIDFAAAARVAIGLAADTAESEQE
jgi:LAO/AO transport system kinase